jgi:DNA-binding transcriptional regulator LsrR (DeoR family)
LTTVGPRQQAALAAIQAHWRAYGEAPTRAELGRTMGISAVSAHLLIKKLASAGLVVLAPRLHRNVEVA